MGKIQETANDQLQSDIMSGFDEVLESINKLIKSLDRVTKENKTDYVIKLPKEYLGDQKLVLSTQDEMVSSHGKLCHGDTKIDPSGGALDGRLFDDVDSRPAESFPDKMTITETNNSNHHGSPRQFTEKCGCDESYQQHRNRLCEAHKVSQDTNKSLLTNDVMINYCLSNGRHGIERGSFQAHPGYSNTHSTRGFKEIHSSQPLSSDNIVSEINSGNLSSYETIGPVGEQISQRNGVSSLDNPGGDGFAKLYTLPHAAARTSSGQPMLVRSSPMISKPRDMKAGKVLSEPDTETDIAEKSYVKGVNAREIMSGNAGGLRLTHQDSTSISQSTAKSRKDIIRVRKKTLKSSAFHKRSDFTISLDDGDHSRRAVDYRRSKSLEGANSFRIQMHEPLSPTQSLPISDFSNSCGARSKPDSVSKGTSRINRNISRLWKTFRASTNPSRVHCITDMTEQESFETDHLDGALCHSQGVLKLVPEVSNTESSFYASNTEVFEKSSISLSAQPKTYKSGANRWSLDSDISVTEKRSTLRERKSSSLVMPDKEFSSGGDDDKLPRRSTIGSSYAREMQLGGSGQQKNKTNVKKSRPATSNRLQNSIVSPAVGRIANSSNEFKKRWSFRTKQGNLATKQRFPENLETSKTAHARSTTQKTKSSAKLAESISLDVEKFVERIFRASGEGVLNKMYEQEEILDGTDLASLCEPECDALQTLALRTLQSYDLGVAITIPKDESRLLDRKRKYGVHLPLTARSKSKNQEDHVFGIPLVRVVENDQLLRLQTDCVEDSPPRTGTDLLGNMNSNSSESVSDGGQTAGVSAGEVNLQRSLSNGHLHTERRSSSPEQMTADQPSGETVFEAQKLDGEEVTSVNGERTVLSPNANGEKSPSSQRAKSSNKPVGRSLKRRDAIGADTNTKIDPYQTELLESLQSASGPKDKKRSLLPSTMPQVPYVVQKCCAHIVKYGLSTTGIFRIAGSKKRVRQLREEFDRGIDVTIDEDYNSHDVAALLKEFFRDLPEALLTRELYPALLSTTKLCDRDRRSAVQSLVWLLPLPNRDTLQQLLSFLANVAEHSEDRMSETKTKIPGNKMGVKNLSTIFGPNILHRMKKSSQSTPEVYSQVQNWAEESNLVIKVVNDMIQNQEELFSIPREVHIKMLGILQETEPDVVDFLLRRKAANYVREKSPVVRRRNVNFSLERDEEDQGHQKSFHSSATTTDQGELLNSNNDNNNNNNNHIGMDRKKSEKKKKVWKWQKPSYKTPEAKIEDTIRYVMHGSNSLTQELQLQDETASRRPERKLASSLSSTGATSPTSFMGSFEERSISFTESEMQEILLANQRSSPSLRLESRQNSDSDASETTLKVQQMMQGSSLSSSSMDEMDQFSMHINAKNIRKKISSTSARQQPQSSHSRRPGFSLNAQHCETESTKCPDCDLKTAHAGSGVTHSMCENMNWKQNHRSARNIYGRNNTDRWSSHHKVPNSGVNQNCDYDGDQSIPPRKRLPSTLNLRLHRMYGGDAVVNRERSRTHRSSDSNAPDPPDATTDDASCRENLANVSGMGRRYSKDDMFLTIRRLHETEFRTVRGENVNNLRFGNLRSVREYSGEASLPPYISPTRARYVVTETLV